MEYGGRKLQVVLLVLKKIGVVGDGASQNLFLKTK